jgi:hypothetical protein
VKAGKHIGAIHEANKLPTSKKYALSWSQYQSLADCVVSQSDVEVKVAPSLLALLQDAISLRKEANQFFESKAFGDDKQKEKNEGHRYAISALESIAKKLERLKATTHNRKPKHAKAKQREQSEIPTSNYFDGLDVEQLSDPIITEPQHATGSTGEIEKQQERKGHSKSRATSKETALVTTSDIEMPAADDDLFMLLFYFFKDIGDVRNHLAELWKDYYHGNLYLATAAVTTDLAFEAVRRQESIFLQSEIVITGRKKTLQTAYEEIAARQTRSAISRFWKADKQRGTDILRRHWCLADLMFDCTYNLGQGAVQNDT